MSELCNCGHEHEHEECGCGCGEQEGMDGVVTLVDEDGVEHGFEIIDMVELDGAQYVAVVPADEEPEEDDESDELVLLKVVAEGVEEFLEAIESEEEFTVSRPSLWRGSRMTTTSSRAKNKRLVPS